MTKTGKIRSLELLGCDAGWRNYHFVKVSTEDGVVGWSEFDEGFGSPGVGAAIQRLSAGWLGKTRLPTNAFMPSFSRRPGPRRAASLPRRSAPSKMRCWMQKRNCWACRVTNCSEA